MLTLPDAYCRGLMTGKTFMEVQGESLIVCNSGLGARLKFLGKPWFGGSYDCVEGVVTKLVPCMNKRARRENTLARIHGKWSTRVYINYENTEPNDEGDEIDVPQDSNDKLLFGVEETVRDALPQVKPLAQQGPLESRRVWYECTKALRKGDWERANGAKQVVEEAQRALRKSQPAKGSVWRPRFFQRVPFCFTPSRKTDENNPLPIDALLSPTDSASSSSSSSPSSTNWSSSISTLSDWLDTSSLSSFHSSSDKKQDELFAVERWASRDYIATFAPAFHEPY